MTFAKRIDLFCIFLLLGFINQAYGEIYQCQTEQGREVFTDNKYDCNFTLAKILSIKPPILRIERKVMTTIPDLSQYDPKAGFPDHGRKYCAPVAVSNSLSSAYGGLASIEQIELALTLGGSRYMATGEKGTSPKQLLQGVDRFLQSDRKISRGQLEYRGQVSVARKYNPTGKQQADLPWLINGVKQEKHIWLNIGWYQTQSNDKKKRVSGHWVTLVGYEKLGSLKDGKGEYLIINDPATQGGARQEQIAIEISKLNGRSGYQLLGQRSKPKKADVAWIEGAIQLAL